MRRLHRIRGHERQGTVFTHTTNEHPYNPAVPVPYNISIVELADQEGLRFTTNVVECPPEDVHIGMSVQVQFEQHGEVFVPVFIPMSWSRRRASDIPAELEPIDAVEAATVLGHLHTLGKAVLGDARCHSSSATTQLTSGEMRSETAVGPGPERDVVVRRAVEADRAPSSNCAGSRVAPDSGRKTMSRPA